MRKLPQTVSAATTLPAVLFFFLRACCSPCPHPPYCQWHQQRRYSGVAPWGGGPPGSGARIVFMRRSFPLVIRPRVCQEMRGTAARTRRRGRSGALADVDEDAVRGAFNTWKCARRTRLGLQSAERNRGEGVQRKRVHQRKRQTSCRPPSPRGRRAGESVSETDTSNAPRWQRPNRRTALSARGERRRAGPGVRSLVAPVHCPVAGAPTAVSRPAV